MTDPHNRDRAPTSLSWRPSKTGAWGGMVTDARHATILVAVAAGILGGAFVIGSTASWVIGRLLHGAPAEQTPTTMAAGMLVNEPPPSGPTNADIQRAAEKALAARFAATKAVTSVSSLRILDKQPTDDPGVWTVQMALTIKTASTDPGARSVVRRKDEMSPGPPPPRWVNVVWSGQRWFLTDFLFQ